MKSINSIENSFNPFYVLFNQILKESNVLDNVQFKKWFLGSKVVDRQGNPLVVFHGTKADISQFKKVNKGTNSNVFGSWSVERSGIFFAEDAEFAHEFAIQGENSFGANIIPAYLYISNPIDLRNGFTDSQMNMIEDAGLNSRYYDRININDIWEVFDHENSGNLFVDMLIKNGYDGAKIQDKSSGHTTNTKVWVAFEPSQIKSAYGNKGTFNIQNDNIIERFSN